MSQLLPWGSGVSLLMLVLWCIFLNAPCLSLAEIVRFEGEKVPADSIAIRHTFFMYSHLDPAAPQGQDGEKSSIKFNGLVPVAESSTLQGYEGLQVALIRQSKIWNVIDQTLFCRFGKLSVKDANTKPAMAKNTDNNDINIITVRSGAQARDVKIDIKESGSYYLIVSNCGGLGDLSVSGSVVAKGPYGFLPANAYYRLSFYAWRLFFYIVVSVIWIALSLRWWKELFQIQFMIGFVMVISVIEVLLWHSHLDDWNRTGVSNVFLLKTAVFMSGFKRVFSLVLCFAASLGWGMTIPFVPEEMKLKLSWCMAVYLVTGVHHEFFATFRHTWNFFLTPSYLFLSWLPSGICIVVIIFWILSALNAQIVKLTERKQPEKLKLFQRLRYCLSFSAVAFSGALLLTGFDAFAGRQYWSWGWFLADGVSHLLFALILVVMMSLWAPNEHSLILAFSHKPGTGNDLADREKGKSADKESEAIWADPSEADGDGKDCFWNPMGGPRGEAPEAAVGASSSSAHEKKSLKETDNPTDARLLLLCL